MSIPLSGGSSYLPKNYSYNVLTRDYNICEITPIDLTLLECPNSY
jgi:hypothetical protein